MKCVPEELEAQGDWHNRYRTSLRRGKVVRYARRCHLDQLFVKMVAITGTRSRVMVSALHLHRRCREIRRYTINDIAGLSLSAHVAAGYCVSPFREQRVLMEIDKFIIIQGAMMATIACASAVSFVEEIGEMGLRSGTSGLLACHRVIAFLEAKAMPRRGNGAA